MQSIFDRIDADVVQLNNLLRQLIGYSDIVRWNFSAIKISGMSDYKWEELNADGKKVQAQSMALYDRFISFVRCLCSDLSGPSQRALESSVKAVQSIIGQTNFLNTLNKEELFHYAINRIEQQRQLLAATYEAIDECAILVPDPALLATHPAPEKWQVSEIPHFKVMNLPQNLRLPTAQYSAEILPWLDPENPEDLLLIICFELIKEQPHASVILATNNPSLQKKAAASNLPFIELPTPQPAAPPVKAAPPVEQASPEPPAKPAVIAPVKPRVEPIAPGSASPGKPALAPAAAKPKPPTGRPAPAAPRSIPPAVRPEMMQLPVNQPHMTNSLLPGLPIPPNGKPNIIRVPGSSPAKAKSKGPSPKPIRK